jgi:hypothetical protein
LKDINQLINRLRQESEVDPGADRSGGVKYFV